jgi:DNA repair protein RadC
MSCANPPPSPGSMRDPTSPRPGEVKIGGTTVRGEAARIGCIALADRQDVRPSLALRPTTGWMARTTRARPGLSEAPDLLALIELARASAAAIGPAQPGSLLSRSMPPDPVQLDATLSGPTFGGPVMSTLALASSGLASPAVTSPALASQARAKLARANPATATPPLASPALAGTDGHRARMRARLLAAGPEALADHEMLEMVLFLALPRGDTKPLARMLLTRFGSFAGAIAAPVTELSTIDGLGEAGVAALKLVQAAALRLLRSEVINRPVLANWDRLMAYLIASLARERVEQFRVLFLDTRNRLLADEAQGRGTVNHTPVYPREVVKRALELHATALILVHNHPSGDPTHSAPDIDMTREIRAAAEALSIVVHDHVIFGNDRWLSLPREGLL